MRERKISVGKRTLVCGAGGGIETEEDDPKLWRRSSQSAEKMLSGDWSPESLKGASGKRLRRSVVAISDRSPILRRSEVKILLPHLRPKSQIRPYWGGARHTQKQCGARGAAMPTNYIVKAFLSELNHAFTAAPSGIVVGAKHGHEATKGGALEGLSSS